MTATALADLPALKLPFIDALDAPLTRGALSRALGELCAATGAQNFCLADLSRSHAEAAPKILACNWSFDAIEIIGTACIETLYHSPFAAALAELPRAFETGKPTRSPRVIDEPSALRLIEFGHAEIFALKLRAGVRRGICLFSTPLTGRINSAHLHQAHLVCNYLIRSE